MTVPGKIPPRRTRTVVNEPPTPSNSQGPSVCGNCQCLECPGPCLSPLSRPPYCGSCTFRHGPTYMYILSAPMPLHVPPHPQLLPTILPPSTTSEQCLASCPPIHLYILRDLPPLHLLPPPKPLTQQSRPKPI